MNMLYYHKIRSIKSDPAMIVQKAISDGGEGYDKRLLIEQIQKMNGEQFHQFCNDIRRLQHFYDFNQSAWATDREENIPKEHRGTFWRLV